MSSSINSATVEPLSRANLTWESSVPRSVDYDDIYFHEDGIDETHRVFIGPTQLAALADSQAQVTIGELGFGTGLNFALAAQTVLESSCASLHFISFELHPLAPNDWSKVVETRRKVLPIYTQIGSLKLPPLSGWHRRYLADGRVTLSVFHGDVADGLQDVVERHGPPVDIWFLDGFAPRRNEAMWSAALWRQIAAASRTGTRVATFTAASHVRRGLQSVGFEVRRVDQRPQKRESLAGTLTSNPDGPQLKLCEGIDTRPEEVVIHGAGVGGATLARRLAELGVQVTVYDPNSIASGGSSIPAALMHPRLLGDRSVQADYRVGSFHHAMSWLKGLPGTYASGVTQLSGANAQPEKLRRIADAYGASSVEQATWLRWLESSDPSARDQLDGAACGLVFPAALAVDLPVLCRHLLEHERIRHISNLGGVNTQCPQVLCNGSQARHWDGLSWLEIADVVGQIDAVEWAGHHIGTEADSGHAVVNKGYRWARHGKAYLGATYEYTPWSVEEATQFNLKNHSESLPAHWQWKARYRASRAVTSDRVPFIGHLGGNVWIATGHGSGGTTSAPFAAEILTSLILGWLPPTSRAVVELVSPRRIKERQKRRGVRHVKGGVPPKPGT